MWQKGGEGMKILYLGLIIIVTLLAGDVWSAGEDRKKAADDLEKTFGLKFDEIVKGSDSEPAKADSAGEVTTRSITGVLGVFNGTGKPLYVARGRLGNGFLGLAMPGILSVLSIWDPSGGTHLWACPYKCSENVPPSTSKGCYYKYLNDSYRVKYNWWLP
jgi:hypothetical protein